MGLTSDRNDPGLQREGKRGLQEVYLIDKGEGEFVRPVRTSYKHVGIPAPEYDLRELTSEEEERYSEYGYVKYEEYPEGSSALGKYWTQPQLDKIGKGCGTVTNMHIKLSETYARTPSFYGATYCAGCQTHLPVGKYGEFIWVDDGVRVGT